MNSIKKDDTDIKKEKNARFSIGLHLKSQREMKKITLDEVAQKTRITKMYLEAIESDNMDIIPAEVYRRGFIKNYCNFLGLDADDLLKKYDETQVKTELKRPDAIIGLNVNEKDEDGLNLGQWIIIVILIIALFAGIYYLIFL